MNHRLVSALLALGCGWAAYTHSGEPSTLGVSAFLAGALLQRAIGDVALPLFTLGWRRGEGWYFRRGA